MFLIEWTARYRTCQELEYGARRWTFWSIFHTLTVRFCGRSARRWSGNEVQSVAAARVRLI